jgi:hypothetical protein
MRQKYFISKDRDNRQLKIREYASILKMGKNALSSMSDEDTFAFLYEEIYESSVIVNAIDKGVNALIDALRTYSLFPIASHAHQIAESVMAIYGPGGDTAIELIFDDLDLFKDPSLREAVREVG